MKYFDWFVYKKIGIISIWVFSSFIFLSCRDGKQIEFPYWLGILNPVSIDSKAISERQYSPNGSLTFARFNSDLVPYSRQQAPEVLKAYLQISPESQPLLLRSNRYADRIYDRFQQYYKNIKVENGIYTIESKDNTIESMSGNFSEVPSDLITTPSLSETDALSKALKHFGAKKYIWESPEREEMLKTIKKDSKATYFPKGELLISKLSGSQKNEFRLVYRFGIAAIEPSASKYIHVDANSGEILASKDARRYEAGEPGPTPQPPPDTNYGVCFPDKTPCIKTGSAATRFSGVQSIITWTAGKDNYYELKDYSRGKGIFTYSWEFVDLGHGNESYKVPFSDSNNIWTSSEYHDDFNHDALFDAHWGIEKTYDYFKVVHNRLSYDGNDGSIANNVHYARSWITNNAYWDDATEELFYLYCPHNNSACQDSGGDFMDPRFEDTTSLDFVSHEYGHGVVAYTSGWGYEKESGALNEGFSDIWNIAVNHFVNKTLGMHKNIWLFGDETAPGGGIRSAQNPRSTGLISIGPTTYKGLFWDFETEKVHINSTVLSHWFYILSNGKQGTNDHKCEYDASGISIEKAEKIAYGTLLSLWPTSEYSDVRSASIAVSKYLYGKFSQEVKSTIDAWDAVGVPSNTTSQGGLGMKPKHFITSVKLSNLERNSGNDCGYRDSTYLRSTVLKGVTYNIQLSSQNSSTDMFPTRTHKWKVWIDFNRDGIFDDGANSTELVVQDSVSVSTEGNIQKSFIVPANALTGDTRMRVSMKASTSSEGYPRSDEKFIEGEVEDYTITIRSLTF
ncbi:M4 family metalopeptidase thermolysin [Leptospira weilii]|uniref:M4 family metalopeptidase thermolysin n=1 Tax=Leptospira weilii TaxID=28184 RepID=UPI000773E3D4|nr:M4 family metallopeptidase [Leptospira weilii]